jgi:hypothetical protein
MKKHMAVALIASLLASVAAIAAPDEAALMAKEKAAWQAFKDKKADDFKKIVGANMKAVYADGIADLQKDIADMQKWDMKSFTIGDYKVTAADADTAISTYTVRVQGSIGGSDASGTYYAGSVWQQKGGDWQAIFHTNVLQQGAAK